MGMLRFILALSVVAGHSSDIFGIRLIDAGTAVHLFFLISGYYMALILTKKYNNLSTFYINRLLRLWPTYLIVLAASVVWYQFTWNYTGKMPPPYWVADAYREMPLWQYAVLHLSNLSMVGLDLTDLFHYRLGDGFHLFHCNCAVDAQDGAHWASHFNVIEQAWSISSEIWFYALAPLLVRRRVPILVASAGASFALGMLMERNGLPTYFFFPAQLYLFVLGILLYKTNLRLPSWRWDTALGNLSYPIYMTHLLVVAVVAAVFHTNSGNVVAPLTIAVSVLVYLLIEKPVDVYRQRLAEGGRRLDPPKGLLVANQA